MGSIGRSIARSITLALFFCQWFNLHAQETTDQVSFEDQKKHRAYIVLKTKCNSCHATKKRTDSFTWSTMDSLADDIHKQVFIKQKMPKGKKIKLTETERLDLLAWLDVLLKAE